MEHYIENEQVRCLFKDEQGFLWVGTFGGGVLVYSPDFKMIKHFYTAEQFPSNTINSIYGDSKKRIWVATGEGLVCFPSPNNMKYQVFKEEMVWRMPIYVLLWKMLPGVFGVVQIKG